MTVAIIPKERLFFGTVIMTDASQETNPASYKDIADANETLHKVLKALLKERSGQTLTETERRLIEQHIAAQKWQLEHTNMEQS